MLTLTIFTSGLLALLQPVVQQIPDKGMSSAHFIYIPGSVILGIVIGYVLGARALRAELAAEQKKAAARAARKSAS